MHGESLTFLCPPKNLARANSSGGEAYAPHGLPLIRAASINCFADYFEDLKNKKMKILLV